MIVSQPKRLIQLDFLRGIAILLVLGHHSIQPPEEAGRLVPLARFLRDFGWSGVDLFFVLSGFLIGGLLFSELRKSGTLNVRRFIIRRGFKIWPLYYLYLLLLTTVVARHEHRSLLGSARRLLPCFTHTQNYTMHASLYIVVPVAHLWSLAVEEHFYLLLPLLLLFLARRAPRPEKALPALVTVACGVLIGCLALRLARMNAPFVPEQTQWPTHLRIDSLFFGVLTAYAWHYHRESLQSGLRRKGLLLLVGTLLIAPLFWMNLGTVFTRTLGFTFAYLGYAAILLGVMASTLDEGRLSRFFQGRFARVIAFVGFFSYPIYLFQAWPGHIPAVWMLTHHLYPINPTLHWSFIQSLTIVAAIGCGIVFGKMIERPALALRDRIFPANEIKPMVTAATNNLVSAVN